MVIELEPPTGAAGVHIGASRADATRQLEVLGEPRPFRRDDEANASLTVVGPAGLPVFVYFDDTEVVEAVELGRPDGDEVVTYDGIDVFRTPADEVVEELGRRTRVGVEEGGRSVTAPELLLALWRPTVPEGPDDDEGRYFESALVARPGYYD